MSSVITTPQPEHDATDIGWVRLAGIFGIPEEGVAALPLPDITDFFTGYAFAALAEPLTILWFPQPYTLHRYNGLTDM